MTELFRALDPTTDNRLILHRADNRAGEPVYTFTIHDGDNIIQQSVTITATEADAIAEHLLLGAVGRRR